MMNIQKKKRRGKKKMKKKKTDKDGIENKTEEQIWSRQI